jgi:hypothetical protein
MPAVVCSSLYEGSVLLTREAKQEQCRTIAWLMLCEATVKHGRKRTRMNRWTNILKARKRLKHSFSSDREVHQRFPLKMRRSVLWMLTVVSTT